MISTKEIIEIIKNAPKNLREYAHNDEMQYRTYKRGQGCTFSGWSYGSAKSLACYLNDNLKSEDLSEVDWHVVAEFLDKNMPVNN